MIAVSHHVILTELVRQLRFPCFACRKDDSPQEARPLIGARWLQALRAAAAARSVQLLTQSVEGREGLLAALERAVRDDAPLRLQLEMLLRPPGPPTNSRKAREM